MLPVQAASAVAKRQREAAEAAAALAAAHAAAAAAGVVAGADPLAEGEPALGRCVLYCCAGSKHSIAHGQKQLCSLDRQLPS